MPLFSMKSNYEGIEFPPYFSKSHQKLSDQQAAISELLVINLSHFAVWYI